MLVSQKASVLWQRNTTRGGRQWCLDITAKIRQSDNSSSWVDYTASVNSTVGAMSTDSISSEDSAQEGRMRGVNKSRYGLLTRELWPRLEAIARMPFVESMKTRKKIASLHALQRVEPVQKEPWSLFTDSHSDVASERYASGVEWEEEERAIVSEYGRLEDWKISYLCLQQETLANPSKPKRDNMFDKLLHCLLASCLI